MAVGLVLEFEGVGAEQYWAVNEALGIDAATGTGDWPAGMISHSAGAQGDNWVVIEVWESEEAAKAFFDERLAEALPKGGITEPPVRQEMVGLTAHHAPA